MIIRAEASPVRNLAGLRRQRGAQRAAGQTQAGYTGGRVPVSYTHLCNVFLCYTFYILAICFPDVIWLGASQVLCVLVQLGAHALLINFSLKDIYNPGLGSTLFLQAPVAIYYIWYVVTRLPEKAGQIWIGIPGAFAAMIICLSLIHISLP